VVIATWEAAVGESWSEASLGTVSVRPYPKNKLKAKRLEVQLKWYSTCLASMRP
jgi:hypothetical protein